MPMSLAGKTTPGVGQSGVYRPPASAMLGRIEALQLAATVASLPRATLASSLLSGVLLALGWTPSTRDLLFQLLMLSAGATGASALAAKRLKSSRSTARVQRSIVGVLALFAGGALAAMIFVALGKADATDSVILAAVVAAALGSTALAGPLAFVGLLALAPLALAGTLGFALHGGLEALLAPFVLLAAVGIGSSLRYRERADAAATCDRLRVQELAETVDALLLDEEAGAQGWVFETDAAGRLRDAAPDLAASLGVSGSTIDRMLFKSLLAPKGVDKTASAGARAVRRAMTNREPFRDRLVEIATPRGTVWWKLSGKPLADATGAFAGYRGFGNDVTAARDTEARIAYLANFDPLTELANRENFRTRAGADCAAAVLGGHWHALLYVDLDGFKSTNDGLGHAAGDRVLKEAARRLAAVAPAEALVARLGGDEFAIWLAATPARAEDLAARLLEVLGTPFDLDGVGVAIAASIGIAYAPRHASTPDALLGKADLALYRAKSDGKGVARTFAEADELAVIEKRKLEADLKLALARGEFELHYQPVVELTNGEVTAFEALLRWRSPTRGLVAPGEFVPAAESSGLIAPIGRWVLAQACRDAATWPHAVRVAVNISPREFDEPDFLHNVARALQASGVPASRLEIEVTEGVFLGRSTRALEHLTALRESGITIALDDFGTGYSSLSYLTRFPVDKIKIDRAFVQNIHKLEDQAIVEAILTLARRLSIRVTAEGVETAEQALELVARRCDDIQGYLLSKPHPAAEVPAMLAEASATLHANVPLAGESPLALALAMRRKSA